MAANCDISLVAADGPSHDGEPLGPSTRDPVPSREHPAGRRDDLDRLMPEVYEELRVIARRRLAGHEGGGTLSTTGLVHETWLKLVDQSRVTAKENDLAFLARLEKVLM